MKTDPGERLLEAVDVNKEMEGLPLDILTQRANKALAEKQWPLAATLFGAVATKALHLSAHAFMQEVEYIKKRVGD